MENYIGEIVTAIITGLAGLGAWFHERKQREIEGQASAVDLYQELLDDLKKRYDDKFEALESEMDSLKRNVDLWKGKYRTLKKEFDDYKTKKEDG